MSQENNEFGSLFEASIKKENRIVHLGEKVKGTISMIGKNTVFVNLGTRADGIMDPKDLLDSKGEMKFKVGDEIEAYCMESTEDGLKLVRSMGRSAVDSSVEDAYNAGMPIDGKVTGERKGGFTVQVANAEGFCPFSQIDARGVKKEPAEYIGQVFPFQITEYSEEGRNIVLSRRKILEKEAARQRDELKASLAVGDIRTGTVTRIMPFGAFVDLGGVEGMVHVSEMGWGRGLKVEDCVSEGQEVTVKVLDVNWGDDNTRERISLSIKQTEKSPWERIPEDPTYAINAKRHGKVSRLTSFGAFIELEPGVEGLAHISQLGVEEHVDNPADVLKEGQEVDVTILGLDLDRRRISLCIGEPKIKEEKPAELSLEEEKEIIAINAGERVEGEVESLKPFGVFIKLPNGETGLLHISQTGITGNGNMQVRALYKAFPLHKKVEVVVREVTDRRISLSLPEILEQEQERDAIRDVKDAESSDFGSLGDVFGKLNL